MIKLLNLLMITILSLVPTNDGGYYLIGMKVFAPEIFENKAYSTDKVLDQTIDQIEKLDKTWFKLPVLVDIDMEEDLGKLEKMIKK